VTGWDFSDAWVLCAVALGGTSSRADVVAAGDALNHAILTDGELDRAFRRLAAAGLVTVGGDGRVSLTDAGRALAARRRGGQFAQVDSLYALLRGVPLVEP
jgi:lipid-binding SYLF domain-containing protein